MDHSKKKHNQQPGIYFEYLRAQIFKKFNDIKLIDF